MIEVAPNLFVGGSRDLVHVLNHDVIPVAPQNVKDGWHVISAAKDPFHREALGYTTRGAPKDHPEYLIAHRKNRTILNLVDAADPAYIRDEIIDVALGTIDMHLAAGEKVLIHCNEGKSRAPTIAMLWMAQKYGYEIPAADGVNTKASMTVDAFKRIYPDYAPAEGMRLYAQQRLFKMLDPA